MTTLKSFFRNTLLLVCLFISGSCSASKTSSEIILVGSTPGDELIKSLLSIPTDTKVDFINWNLQLNDETARPNTFILNTHFGASQPNTLGFINNGEKQSFEGTFTVFKNTNMGIGSEIYQLKNKSFPNGISLLKISENLFHLLTPQNQLMVGNGGWSYSLNRKTPVYSNEILISSSISDDKSVQTVFDGRTPCQEIATEHPEMNANTSCFKLKWRLILNRDSVTHLPTTCTIRNIVDNQPRDVSGKWTIVKGTETNPEAIIYKIQVDNLAEPILFFVGDENVLFFIDKNYNPFVGNEDFSFAMNKRVN